MHVITLLNEKGGVAKTTLSLTLAAGLARDGFRVLILDTDPQATGSLGFGLEREPGFYDLIQRKAAWKPLLRRIDNERIAPEVSGQLWMLPGNRETRSVSVEKASLLLQRLQELQGTFDFVVIDTAPSASLLHILIYMATDSIIHPTQLEYFSLEGLSQSLEALEEYSLMRRGRGMPAIEMLGVVPTMTMLKTLEHRTNMMQIGQSLDVPIFDPIPHSTTWTVASATQRSIFAYDSTSKAAAVGNRFVRQVEAALGLTQA